MKNETKHTPGPWRAEWLDSIHCWIMDDGGNYLATMVLADEEGRHRRDDAEANARLIAAAPELLEAAKGIEEAARNGWPLQEWPIDDLRAAIAKAEGGEQ